MDHVRMVGSGKVTDWGKCTNIAGDSVRVPGRSAEDRGGYPTRHRNLYRGRRRPFDGVFLAVESWIIVERVEGIVIARARLRCID